MTTLPHPQEGDQQAIAEGFQTLLELQQELQVHSFGLDPTKLAVLRRGNPNLADFVRWNAYALINELVEATNEIAWKPWAESDELRIEAFAREMVDLLHFFANLCLAVGVDGDMLADGYITKRRINAQRQEEGYDGFSGKCPECGRSYDDVGRNLDSDSDLCHICLTEARLA